MARVFVSHSSLDNTVAAEIFTWLREQGFEESFLDIDETAGLRPGSPWEQQLYEQLDRCNAVLLVLTPNWHASKWCFAEFVQARSLGKAIFPIVVAPTGDRYVAPDIQQLDLVRDRDGGLRRLAGELTRIALDSQGGFPWAPGRPPYPGMLAFERDDAAIYFGRDPETRALIERLEARRVQGGARVVAVLGASGSGKSSLLRAGVLPRLARYSDNWVVAAPLRPGRDPAGELAKTLAEALGAGSDAPAWRALDERLGADPAALAEIAADVLGRAGRRDGRLLVSVDQAEELFTLAPAAQAERLFALLAAAAQAHAPLLVVLTLRSDYLGLLQPLAERIGGVEEFSLAPLPSARFAQIVEGPARVAGVAIGAGLVAAATRDAADGDALPLLAFALRELHDHAVEAARAAGTTPAIGLADYQALGDSGHDLNPLENAVRRRAEAIVAALDAGAVEALREAFVGALTRVDDAGRYSRRAATWAEIAEPARQPVQTFVEARLLVTRGDGGGDRVVEVAHEALLRKWPRLVAWLDHERDFLLGRQRLERAQADWLAAPPERRDDALLEGLLLERARGWLGERPQALGEAVRAFVTASAAAVDRRRARTARRRRIAYGAASATLAAVAALVVFAYFERRASADLATEIAAERWRQRSAASLERGEAEDALAQGRAAWGLRPDAKSRSALLQAALAVSPYFAWQSRATDGRVRAITALAWAGNGALIAGDAEGHALAIEAGASAPVRREIEVARLRPADVNQPEAFLAAGPGPGGGVVAVLEDGRVLSGDERGLRVVANLPPQRQTVAAAGRLLTLDPDAHVVGRSCAPSASAVACTPGRAIDGLDGARLLALAPGGARAAAALADGRIVAFDPAASSVGEGAVVARLPAAGAETASALAWNDDGTRLAVATSAGRILFVDGAGAEIATLQLADHASARLAWAPDGRRLAADCAIGTTCVWSLGPGRPLHLDAVLAGHAPAVNALAWSADASLLASADIDGRVRVWRPPRAGSSLAAGRPAILRTGGGAATDVDASADGRWLAASDALGQATIWALTTGEVAHRLASATQSEARAVRLHPNRPLAALATVAGGAVVFDLAAGTQAPVDATATVETVAWDRHAPRLYVGAQDGSVAGVPVEAGAQRLHAEPFPERHDEAVLVIAIDPAAEPPVLYSADTRGVVLAHGGEHGPVLAMAEVAASGPIGLDALAFSDGGRTLVAAGNSPDVFVFERAGRRLLARLETGAAMVASAAPSPDGEFIAAADNGGRLHLWRGPAHVPYATLDLRREPGRQPGDPAGALGQPRRLAWLADSRRLAVATQSGAILIIPIDVESALDRAASLVRPTEAARP